MLIKALRSAKSSPPCLSCSSWFFGEDENVIQIEYNKIVQKLEKNVVHEVLKTAGALVIPKYLIVYSKSMANHTSFTCLYGKSRQGFDAPESPLGKFLSSLESTTKDLGLIYQFDTCFSVMHLS